MVGWFRMERPTKMHDFGASPFQETYANLRWFSFLTSASWLPVPSWLAKPMRFAVLFSQCQPKMLKKRGWKCPKVVRTHQNSNF